MKTKKDKLIRVTAVLDFVESKWKEYWWRSIGFDKADRISKESAEFGTSVHNLVEATLLDRPFEPESEEQALCADAILSYLKQHNIKPLFETYDKSLEIEVKDEKLGLVGHFDFAAKMGLENVPYIIDFKTSNKMRKSFPLQKAAYAKMCNKMFGTNINNGLTIRSHWNKEKKKVEFETMFYDNLLKFYWKKFEACLTVYKYFNGK